MITSKNIIHINKKVIQEEAKKPELNAPNGEGSGTKGSFSWQK